MNLSFANGNVIRSTVLWIGVTLAAGCALLYFFNPAAHGFFPVCMFHRVTGLNCPGCGGLRAVHQLLHGHLATAFRLNPLFIVAIPVGIVFVLRALLKKSPREIFLFQPMWLWIGLAVIIAFGIARNLPFAPFAWMAQLPQ